jgi:hypothetical protein
MVTLHPLPYRTTTQWNKDNKGTDNDNNNNDEGMASMKMMMTGMGMGMGTTTQHNKNGVAVHEEGFNEKMAQETSSTSLAL